MGINYSEKIPNNVDISADRRLQRALEKWQPAYLDWWAEMGPTDFNTNEIYLRTAISVDRDGWADFGHVKMPDYRWGIFLTPNDKEKKIGFGDHEGEDVWQEVPGEHRNNLRRLIVTQADTEPASVEQQRLLGHTAPSLYDMRNLFQVNVEEGRHLWAMVYLLHSHFGKDGREEAEELLERRSGNPDHPRILSTFNDPVEDWLSFFCFTTFTDRDGKYQLLALAESGFDPLARTCRFMLTEEAHHMFVGQTGVNRVIKRACEVMTENPQKDIKEYGAIPLEIIQKYINRWASSSVDLFGSEVSSNAATFFAAGLKGRAYEEKNYQEHRALDQGFTIEEWDGNRLSNNEVPLRNAMNEVLRSDYHADNVKQTVLWNKATASFGIDFQFTIPHRRFNRRIGMYADGFFTPEGDPISEEEFNQNKTKWLPTEEDEAFVKSLMVKCHEPGKFAGWIAPPSKGINDQSVDFDYVRL